MKRRVRFWCDQVVWLLSTNQNEVADAQGFLHWVLFFSDRFCKPLFGKVSCFGCLFRFCVYWTVNNFIASQTQSNYSWSRDQIEPACSPLNWTLEPACSSIEPACSPWLWSYWTERLTGQRAFTKKISNTNFRVNWRTILFESAYSHIESVCTQIESK